MALNEYGARLPLYVVHVGVASHFCMAPGCDALAVWKVRYEGDGMKPSTRYFCDEALPERHRLLIEGEVAP